MTSALVFAAGAIAVASLGLAAHVATGAALIGAIERDARRVLGAGPVTASFRSRAGALSRHPMLSAGHAANSTQRRLAAQRIAAISGVGGIGWSSPDPATGTQAPGSAALHCQDQVEAILDARTIRFAEGSAALDPASAEVLDEVAAALTPCRGSIVAVIGHSDAGGDDAKNLALSLDRARAVREALTARGIARDALRARGEGSSHPRDGLAASDPANRRIEFRVIFTAPVQPTIVDAPGAG